jgi:hypothetical protein
MRKAIVGSSDVGANSTGRLNAATSARAAGLETMQKYPVVNAGCAPRARSHYCFRRLRLQPNLAAPSIRDDVLDKVMIGLASRDRQDVDTCCMLPTVTRQLRSPNINF